MIPSSETAWVTKPIFFEPFLRALKGELGYAIDIGKYKQLTAWVNNPAWLAEPLPLKRLHGVCRVLFLQNHEHQARFDELFAVFLWQMLQQEDASMPQEMDIEPIDRVSPSIVGPVTPQPNGPDPNIHLSSDLDPEPPDDAEKAMPSPTTKYLNLTLSQKKGDYAETEPVSFRSEFLLTDAYLPLGTRDMIQAWRKLRKVSGWAPGRRLNVEATIQHIAKEGMLIAPVFQQEPINAESMLLILVDRKGSMTPFHHLTDKLLDTAREEGGHRKALVYYFYNCPQKFVYQNPDLTGAVPLAQLYAKINPSQTNTLIISDAGAARGSLNQDRLNATRRFLFGDGQNPSDGLPGLQKAALFVCWLNPLPYHRWTGTTAAQLANNSDPAQNVPMFSLMDDKQESLLKAVKCLMGR